jgi:hypothetical protein
MALMIVDCIRAERIMVMEFIGVGIPLSLWLNSPRRQGAQLLMVWSIDTLIFVIEKDSKSIKIRDNRLHMSQLCLV